MQITILVKVCFALATVPSCHETIASQAEGALGIGCLVAEAQTLTEWKQHSIYRGDQWTIEGVRCVAGNEYVIKEHI